MRRKKNFTMTKGHYFFTIKMGFQNNITISRENKADAVYAFKGYLKQKKECEWLGKWDGKNFIDSDFDKAA